MNAAKQALALSGVQTAVRIALGFLSAKISAIYLGPAGMAVVAQVTTLIQLFQGCIANGTSTAVINLTATGEPSRQTLSTLWGTALKLVAVSSLIAFVVLAMGADVLSKNLLGTSDYWFAIPLAGIAILCATTEAVLSAALNGMRQVRKLSTAAIIGNCLEVCTFVSFIVYFGLTGGLAAASAICVVKLLVTSIVARHSGISVVTIATSHADWGLLRKILPYFPMLMVHSAANPAAQILVRYMLSNSVGEYQCGLVQATWRLSEIYVGILSTALSMYFMALYSTQATIHAKKQLALKTALQFSALCSAVALLIYLCRDLVIRLVLTADFAGVGDLLFFQLLGDVARVAAMPLQMAMVSDGRSRPYVAQVLISTAFFPLLTSVLLAQLGAEAATTGYFVAQSAALLALVYFTLVRRHKP